MRSRYSGFALGRAEYLIETLAENRRVYIARGGKLLPLPEGRFAKNDVGFIDPTGVDHDTLGLALKKAIYNYMHGIALDDDVRNWFDLPRGQVPKPTVSRNRIARALGYV